MDDDSPSREDTLQWLLQIHEGSLALKAAHWVERFFTDDAVLHFANISEVQGKENLIKFYDSAFASLDYMKHDVVHFDVVDNKIYQQATITYIVKEDPLRVKITIPGFAVFHRFKGADHSWRIAQIDVYVDPSPLKERAAAIHAGQ